MGELGHREEPRYDLRWDSETSRKIKQGTTRSHLHGKVTPVALRTRLQEGKCGSSKVMDGPAAGLWPSHNGG